MIYLSLNYLKKFLQNFNMKYDELIKTISEIINNDSIVKRGLTLVYELDDHSHKKMDEHLFYTSNPSDAIFEHKDMY